MVRKRFNTNTNYRRQRGLTLLEVIVAMTLLTLGITGALAAISACVRSNDAAASYSRAALLAQQVATSLERNTTMTSGTLTGTFDDQSTGSDDSLTAGGSKPNADFTWSATIAAADANGLYAANITISWQGGQRQYTLNTVLRPRTPPPAAWSAT